MLGHLRPANSLIFKKLNRDKNYAARCSPPVTPARCCFIDWCVVMCAPGLVTLNDMKAKQEALVKEREKQLAKKEQSKELQLWVFIDPSSLCFFYVSSAINKCFLFVFAESWRSRRRRRGRRSRRGKSPVYHLIPMTKERKRRKTKKRSWTVSVSINSSIRYSRLQPHVVQLSTKEQKDAHSIAPSRGCKDSCSLMAVITRLRTGSCRSCVWNNLAHPVIIW